jgi:hypothetical protein
LLGDGLGSLRAGCENEESEWTFGMGDLDDRDDELRTGLGIGLAWCLESGKPNRLFLVGSSRDRVEDRSDMGRASVRDIAGFFDSDIDVIQSIAVAEVGDVDGDDDFVCGVDSSACIGGLEVGDDGSFGGGAVERTLCDDFCFAA